INYRHFVGDKKYFEKGYENVIIIDSVGNFYKVNGTRQIGGISIIDSIKKFGILVKVEPILVESPRKIEINEVKKIIIEVINKHNTNLVNLDDKNSLVKSVKNSSTIKEVINVF